MLIRSVLDNPERSKDTDSRGQRAMRLAAIVFCVVLSVLGCGRRQEPSPPQLPPPIVLNAPAEFTMAQRSTVPLPGSHGKIVITIDDITRGQVLATLSWQDGKSIMATRSLRPNDVLDFTVDNHEYKIKLKKLKNVLIGEDYATFELWPVTAEMDHLLSENEKIEKLILSLKQIRGAKFIRNGKEYTADEAVAHLREKWEWKKSEIKTAEDFIRIVGAESSVSGEPYLIRFSDGKQRESEAWFREQLKLLEKRPP
jgi:hypothetical protein